MMLCQQYPTQGMARRSADSSIQTTDQLCTGSLRTSVLVCLPTER